MNYSVLMSVYYKENPEYLREAMDSIWEQTVGTDDFLLVCDGPLTEGLDHVIEEMERNHQGVLRVIRLEVNRGLGNALNSGLQYCKNDLVARMDSDDISYPDRCERQLKVFNEKADISISSGIVEEFVTDKEEVLARRVLPEKHEEIVPFSKKRNPFSHPCVMFKKSAVEEAGGYKDLFALEDYYLWVRMLQHGFRGYNLQVPLLWMRAGSDMYKRRSGWKYLKSQKKLFEYMYETRFINRKQYFSSVLTRSISSLLPNAIREFLFKILMRE